MRKLLATPDGLCACIGIAVGRLERPQMVWDRVVGSDY
jgi:hypothetical protein